MCEDSKCMHHKQDGGCKQGIKMLCKRRYKFLDLKYKFVEVK